MADTSSQPSGGLWDVPKTIAAVGSAVLVLGIAAFVLTKPAKESLAGYSKRKKRRIRR